MLSRIDAFGIAWNALVVILIGLFMCVCMGQSRSHYPTNFISQSLTR